MGCGNKVIVGVDPLTVMEDMSTLLEPLINYLGDYGIDTLDQACSSRIGCLNNSYWMSAKYLDLGGSWPR